MTVWASQHQPVGLANRVLGQHNDSRMNVALIMTAVKHGAAVANHTEVVKLHKDGFGKLNGARVRDNLTGKEWDVKAKVCPPVHAYRVITLSILTRG